MMTAARAHAAADVVLGAAAAAGLLVETGLRHPASAWTPLHLALAMAIGISVAARRRAPVAALVVTVGLLLAALSTMHSTHAALLISMLSAATVAYRGRRLVSLVVAVCLVPITGLAWWILGADDGRGDLFIYIGFSLAAVAVADALRSRRDAAAARRDRELLASHVAAREMFDAYRTHLARELHDGLAHTLVAITTRASVAAHLHAAHGHPELIQALDDVTTVSTAALEDLRATLRDVRDDPPDPPIRVAQSAEAAIRNLAQPLTAAGLHVNVHCAANHDEDIPPLSHDGYRIVQESLTNVLRHANASTVTIVMAVNEDTLVLDITNDGPATATPIASTGGHGLLGMRERVATAGGTLNAGPRPSGGWEVRASLPIVCQ